MKRRVKCGLSGILALVLLGSLGWGVSPFTGSALGAESVVFSLDWVPWGKHSGFYTVLHKGYYKAEGLNVTIERGFGSGDTIKRVNVGSAPFGFADTASLVVARSRGSKVKVTGMFHDDAMYIIYTLEGSGIVKPKDLEGRTMGTAPMDAGRIIFPAFAGVNRFNEKRVKWIDMTPAARMPSLLTGKVDAVVDFTGHELEHQRAAAKVGKKIRYMKYKDWGVNPYANGIITTDEMIEKKPDLIRRFMRATWNGVAYAVENPAEAVEMFRKTFPERDTEILRAAWEVAVDHLLTATAKEKGMGYMTRERMTYTRDLVTEYMKLERKVEVDALYSNAFIPKLFPRRGK